MRSGKRIEGLTGFIIFDLGNNTKMDAKFSAHEFHTELHDSRHCIVRGIFQGQKEV